MSKMEKKMNYQEIVNFVKSVAIEAGNRIMQVYNRPDFEVQLKSDNSPITLADRLANVYIIEQLQTVFPDFGILSEESKDNPVRLEKPFVWIIDPLDGTKEFIKRNGEFTVNIGLVENGDPRLGVIWVPALADLYFAAEGLGAFYERPGQPALPIHCSTRSKIEEMILMKSRSHAGEKEALLIEKYKFTAVRTSGSSIKLCLIACGEADVYFRFGPTSEWDICAANCILEQAGGKLTDCLGNPVLYNRPDPLNRNGFIGSNNTIHTQFHQICTELMAQ
jgi:3'(2'), 5'-bisphosphate nucleotidase